MPLRASGPAGRWSGRGSGGAGKPPKSGSEFFKVCVAPKLHGPAGLGAWAPHLHGPAGLGASAPQLCGFRDFFYHFRQISEINLSQFWGVGTGGLG